MTPKYLARSTRGSAVAIVAAMFLLLTTACVSPTPTPEPDCVVPVPPNGAEVVLSPNCKTGMPALVVGSAANVGVKSPDGGILYPIGGSLPPGMTLSLFGVLYGVPSRSGIWKANLGSTHGGSYHVWGWVAEPDPDWTGEGLEVVGVPQSNLWLFSSGNPGSGRMTPTNGVQPARTFPLDPNGTLGDLAPGVPTDLPGIKRGLDAGLLPLGATSIPGLFPGLDTTCTLNAYDMTDPSQPLVTPLGLNTAEEIRCSTRMSADLSTVIVAREAYRTGCGFRNEYPLSDVSFFNVEDLRAGVVDPVTVEVTGCNGGPNSIQAITTDGSKYVMVTSGLPLAPSCTVAVVSRDTEDHEFVDCAASGPGGEHLVPGSSTRAIRDMGTDMKLPVEVNEVAQGSSGFWSVVQHGLGWLDASTGSLTTTFAAPSPWLLTGNNAKGIGVLIKSEAGVSSVATADLLDGGLVNPVIEATSPASVIAFPAD
jgi:hypothetical protein